MSYALPLDTEPMESRSAEVLPKDEGWQYEPKWDGFRCVAYKQGYAVDLRAKSGKPLSRYFPEVIALLRGLQAPQFVLDGELVIEIEGRLAFDALQARLHPAESRIRKLAKETPARLLLFDMLADLQGRRLLDQPLEKRRQALEKFMVKAAIPNQLVLSPMTRDHVQAARWLNDAGNGAIDGVIAKRTSAIYQPGERAMVKVKRLRSADCVVGGFRYESKSREVGSLLLGLYNSIGALDHVGFTSAIKNEERAALTRKLEKLRKAPGFTGNAPGGPSRWSSERSSEWEPLQPDLVVEVQFDHATGNRFRHGTRLLRWRLDKAPRQCTFEQIQPPAADPVF
jgi:ATP-dependent DNA ligase